MHGLRCRDFFLALCFSTGFVFIGDVSSVDAASASTSLDSVSSSANPTNVNSVSWLHTATSTGVNTILVVGAVSRDSTDADRPVVSVTYDGIALTKVRQDDEPVNNVYSSLWYLVHPPSGTHTVTANYAAPVTEAFGTALSFTGVDQTAPIDVHAGYTQSGGTTSTKTVTTTSDNAWVLGIQYAGAGSSATPTSGQAQRLNQQVSIGRTTDRVIVTTKGPLSPTGTTAMSYTYSESSQVALSIVGLRRGQDPQ